MPKSKEPREVYIRQHNETFYVQYRNRNFGQRYLAAQFYAPDTTLEKVKAWVKTQPKLKLIEI